MGFGYFVFEKIQVIFCIIVCLIDGFYECWFVNGVYIVDIKVIIMVWFDIDIGGYLV